MLGNLFSIEKRQPDRSASKINLLLETGQKLQKQNDRLKNEINVLYKILVQKESSIVKLRRFIHEELEKPEYVHTYTALQDQLAEIFQHEDSYDPRPHLEEEEEEQTDFIMDSNLIKLESLAQSGKVDRTEEVEISSPKKNHAVLAVKTAEISGLVNQEQTEPITPKRAPGSPKLNPRSPGSPSKKRQSEKKQPVKPIEQETITRRLFSFELELKEYSFPAFEAVKRFITRPTFTVDEIHDEIDRLSEIASQHKYFQTVFPEETREMVAEELENYIFEILYTKLFIVDEDTRGFSQQFKDRLNVLKSLVTFSLLEIPEPLRKESLFATAVKEFDKMNQFKSPVWKLKAFQNSVNYIINAYHQAMQRDPNSDELFPLLIYMVLHANIDLLKYNVDYAYTYLRKPHLLGQLGFLVINLKAVIQFLQDLNGTSLCEGKLEMRKH